ncbi:MAG: YfcE family phosphodiesterase [Christensenellales bacterium]|jgi:putative phosphoesterase
MRIAVYADTHRNARAIKRAVEIAGEVDLNIHLGDNISDAAQIEKLSHKTCLKVRGNCDVPGSGVIEIVTDIAGKRFFITHGHVYRVKRGLNILLNRARELEADIALYGHTHSAGIDEGVPMLLNPGSLYAPFLGRMSFAIVEVGEEISARIITLPD